MARRTVYLIAGEASGDAIGGRLIAALKNMGGGNIDVAGIGGPAMRKEGLESLFPMQELSLMGLVEILPYVRHLHKRIRETANDIVTHNPDVLITIDAPGFCTRVVDRLKKKRFTCARVHYVAPSVWAWRANRVHDFRARYDLMLCLMPFEPPYFTAVGMEAQFVGHPVIESGAGQGNGPAFRRDFNIPPDAPLVCLLPGSRGGEIARLMPRFVTSLELLSHKHPGLHIVLPAAHGVGSFLHKHLKDWFLPCTLLEDATRKYDAMAASDAALAASGTVCLELALSRVPTVAAYRFNPLTYMIARRLVRTDHGHLLNYMLRREVVPERVQKQCRPPVLATDLGEILKTEGGRQQIQTLRPVLRKLAPTTRLDGQIMRPAACAARAILDILEQRDADNGHAAGS